MGRGGIGRVSTKRAAAVDSKPLINTINMEAMLALRNASDCVFG